MKDPLARGITKDVYLNFRTAFYEQGNLVTSRKAPGWEGTGFDRRVARIPWLSACVGDTRTDFVQARSFQGSCLARLSLKDQAW